MTPTIREAQAEDLDFLVRGNIAMAQETEGVGLDPALVVPGVRAVLDDPSLGRYFVARLAAVPVGQLMITYEWSDWRNGVFWWIQSVFVEPGHRRRGVFAALFRHVARLGQGRAEVCGLRLYVDRDNGGARSAYERLGLHTSNYEIMETVFRGPESRRND